MQQALDCRALGPALRSVVWKVFVFLIFLHVEPVHLVLFSSTFMCILYIVVNVQLKLLLLVSCALLPGLNNSVLTLCQVSVWLHFQCPCSLSGHKLWAFYAKNSKTVT